MGLIYFSRIRPEQGEGIEEGHGLKATGQHLLVEYHDCNREILNDIQMIETLMQDAARAAQATVVASVFHPFTPQGVSGVVVIEESHLSIHTWPEHGYAAVDFFTCGDCLPEKAHEVLKQGLDSKGTEKMLVIRGLLTNETSMEVVGHQRTTASPSEPDKVSSVAAGMEGVSHIGFSFQTCERR